MTPPLWIWQQTDWPAFSWQTTTLAPLLRDCIQAQGRLLGMAGAVDPGTGLQNELDTLLRNIVTSSAIEGAQLNADSVRSSLARRLGLEAPGVTPVSRRSEGLAELMLDATRNFGAPLDLARLLHWHQWLFPEQDETLLGHRVRVGALRNDEPMQVVSGRLDRQTVHFEAPPREGLEQQVDAFLNWFARSADDTTLDPLLRAGIAHFWFVTLHPFEDGNGRLTRAITDLALAQAEHQSIRFYTMSASILDDRKGYYRALETSQRGELDITAWLTWFLQTLLRSLQQAQARIERVLAKARFWQQNRQHSLLPEQIKVLNRLLDGNFLAHDARGGFEHGINAGQYKAVAGVSKATASRHLSDLVDKGCLVKLPGGGRSTRYQINRAADVTAQARGDAQA